VETKADFFNRIGQKQTEERNTDCSLIGSKLGVTQLLVSNAALGTLKQLEIDQAFWDG
jgi:hypothetical protein